MNLKQKSLLLALSFIPCSLCPMFSNRKPDALEEKVDQFIKSQNAINDMVLLRFGIGQEEFRKRIENLISENKNKAYKVLADVLIHVITHSADKFITEEKIKIITQNSCRKLRDLPIGYKSKKYHFNIFWDIQNKENFYLLPKVIKEEHAKNPSTFVKELCLNAIIDKWFWNTDTTTSEEIERRIALINACGKCFKQRHLSETIARQKKINETYPHGKKVSKQLHKQIIKALEEHKTTAW